MKMPETRLVIACVTPEQDRWLQKFCANAILETQDWWDQSKMWRHLIDQWIEKKCPMLPLYWGDNECGIRKTLNLSPEQLDALRQNGAPISLMLRTILQDAKDQNPDARYMCVSAKS